MERFADKETRAIYDGERSKVARRRLPQDLHETAAKKIDRLLAATTLDSLRIPPSNHFEALKGRWAGHYSIRINDQYRIRFQWADEGAFDVWAGDYHDLL